MIRAPDGAEGEELPLCYAGAYRHKHAELYRSSIPFSLFMAILIGGVCDEMVAVGRYHGLG